MRRAIACLAGTAIAAIIILATHLELTRGQPPASQRKTADVPSSQTLDDLVSGRLPIVDLTWTLDENNPYWPAENYEPFRLTTIATIEKNGVLSKAFYTPEHLGTHLDA